MMTMEERKTVATLLDLLGQQANAQSKFAVAVLSMLRQASEEETPQQREDLADACAELTNTAKSAFHAADDIKAAVDRFRKNLEGPFSPGN